METFDRVKMADPQRRRMPEGGVLEAGDGLLEFRGKKGTELHMSPVHDISVSGAEVLVRYGAPPRTASFQDFSQGLMKLGDRVEPFSVELRRAVGLPAPSAEDEARKVQEIAQAAIPEGREQIRRARPRMWIGGAIAVAGILITIITYTAATGGGTYFVAYGAILAGLGMFAQAMAEYNQGKKKAAGLWEPPKLPGAQEKKRQILIVLGIAAAVLAFVFAGAFLFGD
jgi:hypothetical protein